MKYRYKKLSNHSRQEWIILSIQYVLLLKRRFLKSFVFIIIINIRKKDFKQFSKKIKFFKQFKQLFKQTIAI